MSDVRRKSMVAGNAAQFQFDTGKKISEIPAALHKKSTFMDAVNLDIIDDKESSSASDQSLEKKGKGKQAVRLPQSNKSVPRLDLVVEKT